MATLLLCGSWPWIWTWMPRTIMIQGQTASGELARTRGQLVTPTMATRTVRKNWSSSVEGPHKQQLQLQQQQQHQRGSPSPTEARASNGNRSLVDMLANSLREQLYAASSPPKMSSGVPRIYWTRQNRRYSIQRSSAIGNAKPRYVGSVVPQTLTREGLLEALRECVEIVNREAPEAGLDFNAMLANQGGEGEDGHGGGGMAGGASSAHREASPDQAMPDLGCEVQYGGLVMPVEVPVVVKIEQE
mmetsp:Transcript_34314/g.98815  ORF Transcript_34314/g.98815 Transcript_34314/m.98815 type:complete len:245 (+) Transcript_34314:106-840(+)